MFEVDTLQRSSASQPHYGNWRCVYPEAPILNIFVPHTGQVPWVAGRPFFMVICLASLISREALHFTQYPLATATSRRC